MSSVISIYVTNYKNWKIQRSKVVSIGNNQTLSRQMQAWLLLTDAQWGYADYANARQSFANDSALAKKNGTYFCPIKFLTVFGANKLCNSTIFLINYFTEHFFNLRHFYIPNFLFRHNHDNRINKLIIQKIKTQNHRFVKSPRTMNKITERSIISAPYKIQTS